ncbi:MAG: hypothetical protein FWB72_05870 [Firmicutes bacterium]|nr:hypothetical protein [Bacillota bacterium]
MIIGVKRNNVLFFCGVFAIAITCIILLTNTFFISSDRELGIRDFRHLRNLPTNPTKIEVIIFRSEHPNKITVNTNSINDIMAELFSLRYERWAREAIGNKVFLRIFDASNNYWEVGVGAIRHHSGYLYSANNLDNLLKLLSRYISSRI